MPCAGCGQNWRTTMDRDSYENWKRRKPEFRRVMLRLQNKFEGHAPGNRPRDPEKEKLLTRLDIARFERYLATGKIEIVGPRHWKWRVDFGKSNDSR